MIDKEAIKARLEAATPGPWKVVDEELCIVIAPGKKCPACKEGEPLLKVFLMVNGDTYHYHPGESHRIEQDGVPDPGLIAGNYDYEDGGIVEHCDTVFIAHAPTDIADLLEEVERLESELAKFKPCEVSKNHYHWPPDHSQEKVRVYHKEG